MPIRQGRVHRAEASMPQRDARFPSRLCIDASPRRTRPYRRGIDAVPRRTRPYRRRIDASSLRPISVAPAHRCISATDAPVSPRHRCRSGPGASISPMHRCRSGTPAAIQPPQRVGRGLPRRTNPMRRRPPTRRHGAPLSNERCGGASPALRVDGSLGGPAPKGSPIQPRATPWVRNPRRIRALKGRPNRRCAAASRSRSHVCPPTNDFRTSRCLPPGQKSLTRPFRARGLMTRVTQGVALGSIGSPLRDGQLRWNFGIDRCGGASPALRKWLSAG